MAGDLDTILRALAVANHFKANPNATLYTDALTALDRVVAEREAAEEQARQLAEALSEIATPTLAPSGWTWHHIAETQRRIARAALASPSRDSADLAIIGRERALVDGLTKDLHKEAGRHYDYEKVRSTRRGASFRVVLDAGEEGGYGARTARVTVEVEPLDHAVTTDEETTSPAASPGTEA